mmetsp:Transcript_22067/g.54200  ORF Transcript_22067/g.54200 Transcript_22067/m.54200 type:complete len:212 (+) Transcript_22067:2591-3226(+)
MAGDGADERGDAAVLLQGVCQLGVVALELGLLQQDDLGCLRDLSGHPIKALGLADELEDLPVEVDVQFVVVRVTHNQCRLQTSLACLDGVDPCLIPPDLKLNQRLGHLVIHSDDLLCILCGEDMRMLLKHLHGLLDALEQMPGPRDVARDGRQVPHEWRVGLETLVLVLDLRQLQAVVVEDDSELALQVSPETVALQDRLELLEQIQRGLD